MGATQVQEAVAVGRGGGGSVVGPAGPVAVPKALYPPILAAEPERQRQCFALIASCTAWRSTPVAWPQPALASAPLLGTAEALLRRDRAPACCAERRTSSSL